MGPGNGFSHGPQMNCSRRGGRQPGLRLTGIRRAPYSTRRRGEKADIASFQSPPGCAPENGLWALGGSTLGLSGTSLFVVMEAGPAASAAPLNSTQGPMPGAGTDKTKAWTDRGGPIIALADPQLGENIAASARVMANFGLARLRLVKPRDGWPDLQARRSASGADPLLDAAVRDDEAAA